MKALIYQGLGEKSIKDRPVPEIIHATDAVIEITKFEDIMDAYETFGNAANTHALKVIIDVE